GACHLPGTLLRRQNDRPLAVAYIEPTVWHDALNNDARLRLPAPHLRVLDKPVDVVYTWVDGSDPEGRARRPSTRDRVDLTPPACTAPSRARETGRRRLHLGGRFRP